MDNLLDKDILIVDDQPENLQIIIDYFSESNLAYNIIRAPNGEIALEIIKKKCPDLIITDWDMPVVDGIDLIKEIRKIESCAHVPIIMCTGVMTTSENLQTALDAGANDYIRKPVDKIELIARTRSSLLLAESQKRVIQQNKELHELNVTKDKLFSIIGHDLRSPISSTMNMIQVLKKNYNQYDTSKIEEFLSLIFSRVENGFKLLENLLEWSRFQIGKTRFRPKTIKIKTIVLNNIHFLQQNASDKNIELSVDINEDIEVRADENMINTVLRNLLSNAIKFTPKYGKVTIAIQLAGDFANISVIDTGVGIEKENIEKLFKPDIDFTTYGTEEEKGTGLGLCLCHEFIKKHNSNMQVESEPGSGSKFTFSLPVSKID